MEANKILSADILDLVFEGRNKEYGAYELRKTYNSRITRALIITASIALIALGGSFLANSLKSKDSGKLNVKDVVLEDIKQEEEKKPEPPPPPPPKQEPPKVEMTKFTPPKIVKDEEVKKDEIPPETKQLEDTKIDVVSQEGIKDEGLAAPVDQGKQVIEEKKEDDENKIFEKVEIEAAFPGGESAWRKYLERNLNANTPVDNGAPEGSYTVWVQFIVDKEGNISDVKPLTSHGYGMEDEAVKIIKKGPKWTPAQQNGRQVKAYRKQPITFVVQAE
ncbi:MAG: TonB family protein [Bacteroidetes bacterium]|nr:TonB family protein [Bacteroidota bacterium]MBS1608772.1 TonB family protein [Bacteroidota bacterium]